VIARANLDGSNPTPIVTGASLPVGVAVDGAHVYWANSGTNTIARANLDGSAPNESFIGGARGPYGVAVDGDHVYWVNHDTNTIARANLDGSNPTQIVTSASSPWGVAVDALPLRTPSPPPPPAPRPTPSAPSVRSFWLTHRSFRVDPARASGGQRRHRAPQGTAFRYTLSEPATVLIAIERKLAGRRGHGRCVRPTRQLRRGRRCTIYRLAGILTLRTLTAGAHRSSFSGRLGRHALTPGGYRATIVATNVAGRSEPRCANFQIIQ
jgi:hypothetical protein